MTLKLDNSIPKDPYTKQLWGRPWEFKQSTWRWKVHSSTLSLLSAYKISLNCYLGVDIWHTDRKFWTCEGRPVEEEYKYKIQKKIQNIDRVREGGWRKWECRCFRAKSLQRWGGHLQFKSDHLSWMIFFFIPHIWTWLFKNECPDSLIISFQRLLH